MRDWSQDIEKYKRGELNAAEMHALERKALTDPFLADALEGAEQVTPEDFASDVAHLNKELNRKKGGSLWVWPLRVAASVALVIGGYFLINNFVTPSQHQQLSMQQQRVQSQPQPTGTAADSSQVSQDEASSGRVLALQQAKANEKVSVPFVKSRAAKEQPTFVLADEQQKSAERNTQENTLISPTAEAEKEIAKSEIAEPHPSTTESQKEVDGYLDILKRKKASGAPATEQETSLQQSLVAQTISGKVVSAEDGTPLPGVNVVINGSTVGTVTDANGNYQLQSPVGKPTVSFSFIGLKTKQIQVTGSNADVSLETDTAQLSEVVVVGYGVAHNENYTPFIKKAEPVGGLKAYNRYLDNDARYPLAVAERRIKGRVSLKFTVKTDGSLDEFKIVKSMGKLFDEEALRMVKEGPAWNPTTEDNVPVESEVLVRVKFDPSKAGR